MNAVTINAFFDELLVLEKQAGVVSNLGTKILRTAKAGVKAVPGVVKGAPAWAGKHAKETVQNLGNSISAFGTPVESLKKGWKATTTDLRSMPNWQRALMVGGVVADGHEALAKKDPTGHDRGRVERVGASVGSQVGGLIGTPFGATGGLAAGLIGRKIGGTVGKLGDFARGYKKPLPAAPVGG